jgi:hypothetical protein
VSGTQASVIIAVFALAISAAGFLLSLLTFRRSAARVRLMQAIYDDRETGLILEVVVTNKGMGAVQVFAGSYELEMVITTPSGNDVVSFITGELLCAARGNEPDESDQIPLMLAGGQSLRLLGLIGELIDHLGRAGLACRLVAARPFVRLGTGEERVGEQIALKGLGEDAQIATPMAKINRRVRDDQIRYSRRT